MIISTRYSLIVLISTITHLRVDNAILDNNTHYNESSGPTVYMGIINKLTNNSNYSGSNLCRRTPALQKKKKKWCQVNH